MLFKVIQMLFNVIPKIISNGPISSNDEMGNCAKVHFF